MPLPPEPPNAARLPALAHPRRRRCACAAGVDRAFGAPRRGRPRRGAHRSRSVTVAGARAARSPTPQARPAPCSAAAAPSPAWLPWPRPPCVCMKPPPSRPGATRRLVPRQPPMNGDGNCVHVILEGQRANPTQQKIFSLEKQPGPSTAGDADTIRIPVAGRPLIFPPARPRRSPAAAQERPQPALPPPPARPNRRSPAGPRRRQRSDGARHTAFLEASSEMTRACAEAIEIQSRLMRLAGAFTPAAGRPPLPAFTRSQCLEFARGSAARVLGPEFAGVDGLPGPGAAARRTPDAGRSHPVDRGPQGYARPGYSRHRTRCAARRLVPGRRPRAGLHRGRGRASRPLPVRLAGDRSRRARPAHLPAARRHGRVPPRAAAARGDDPLRHRNREVPAPGRHLPVSVPASRARSAGVPLITMTEGCAGFFTAAEVEKSGGIILTEEDRRPLPGRRPGRLVRPGADGRGEPTTRQALAALRAGTLSACFGEAFSGITLAEGLRLPGGRMRLIDRVLDLEPHGGRYGLGRIRAEADIHPDAWFLTCHFVDDMVMPGTLMYECCAHALRVFLQRLGWVGEDPGLRYEPVTGLAATLKCRGPVTPATRRVVYEVDIKELGYGPEPFAVADADMVADGHRIVLFQRHVAEADRDDARTIVESFWAGRPAPAAACPDRARPHGPALRARAADRVCRGQPFRGLRRTLPPLRRGPLHRPPARAALPLHRPHPPLGAAALGAQARRLDRGRIRRARTAPGTLPRSAPGRSPTASCSRSPSSPAAGWRPTWARR